MTLAKKESLFRNKSIVSMTINITMVNIHPFFIVKLGSRSKVYLKSLIRDLDLELVAIIAMPPTTTTTHETFLSRIKLKSLHVRTD